MIYNRLDTGPILFDTDAHPSPLMLSGACIFNSSSPFFQPMHLYLSSVPLFARNLLEPMSKRPGLASYLVSILILLIVTPIFMESFGSFLLYVNDSNAFDSESRAIYFLSTVSGQTSFSLASRINGGFMILPMFEMHALSKDISRTCLLSSQNGLRNTLLCLSVACIVSCVLGLLLYVTNTAKFLAQIPRNITDSIMIMTGILNLYIGLEKVVISGDYFRSGLLMVASVIITAGALVIFGRTKNPMHLLLYLVALILSMNAFRLHFEVKDLVKNRIFACEESKPLSLWAVFDVFLSSKPRDTGMPSLAEFLDGFDFQMIAKNISSIITISILPLISLAISLSIYSKTFGSKISIDREICSLSFTNLVSSLSFYPSHFNCTGSMFFRVCGATTRLHSLLAGISLVFLYFFMHRIIPLIPVFAVSLLLQFIGFSVLMGYLKALLKSTTLDKFLITMLCSFAYVVKMNVLFIILFGLCMNFLVNVFFTRRVFNNAGMQHQEIDGVTYIKINNRLDVNNISSLTSMLDSTMSDAVIDLLNCRYVDYSANCELEEHCKQAGRSIKLIGNPKNLNRRQLL